MRIAIPMMILATYLSPAFPQTSGSVPQPTHAWEWLAPPQNAACNVGATAGTVYIIDDDDTAMVVFVARAGSATKQIVRCRPVVFDGAGKCYPLETVNGGNSNDVTLQQFRLDPEVLPKKNAALIGIEILTMEGQLTVSKEAIQRAKAAGVAVLPLPRVGEAFDFALTTVDGKKISSGELRGKVVLIDCWATWCAPCMAKMPRLKELYEKWHQAGLEVVGVNFDQNADKAREAAGANELQWPTVHVPADEKVRDLWFEAGGIRTLPRLLLVGRDGVLQADCAPYQLEQAIEKLMKARSSGAATESP